MKKGPYVVAMVVLVAIYLAGQFLIHDNLYANAVTTVLAIVAAVAFWMEFRSNERINEAQLIMELNHQFISSEELSKVEWALEKYYAQYLEAEKRGTNKANIRLELDLDLDNPARQHLVNYLVHLEGIAALVDGGILHLRMITNLMAYRYFIAVNNPIVQETELLPYKDYYKGCFRIYENWSKEMGEDRIPMAENGLLKHKVSQSI